MLSNDILMRMTSSRQAKLAYSLKQFIRDDYSLAVFKNGQLFFSSCEHNLRPLAKFILKHGWSHKNLIMFDKYIGRAAALLIVDLHLSKLYTPIISKSAIPVLRSKRINYVAYKKVDHLMGIASQSTCEWEKMSFGKNTASFWRLVKKRLVR